MRAEREPINFIPRFVLVNRGYLLLNFNKANTYIRAV